MVTDAGRLVAAKAEARNDDTVFRFAASAALLRLARRSSLPDVVAQLRSDDVALRAEAAKALTSAGVNLHGYDADQSPEAREAAIVRIEEMVPSTLPTVPYKERK